jgi:RNA polymerase-binding transcription factor DksA
MIPKSTLKAISDRSGGLCENCNKPAQDAAHILHRKMGGRKGEMLRTINDPRNLAALCRSCHDLIDLRRRELYPGERLGALQKIKAITGWEDWRKEL